MEDRFPKVGVGVIVIKGDKVLLGHRIKKSHGTGTWSFGGGHLEFGETIEDCARREVKEESGIEIKNIKIATVTNDIHKNEGKHYITIFVTSEYASGEPKPSDEADEWKWFKWEEMPRPLFLPIENLLQQGFNPFKVQ